MCYLCTLSRPHDPAALYETHAAVRTAAARSELGQIADYLTDGFWDDHGEAPRAFRAQSDGRLYYDVTGLTAPTRSLAVAALQAWSDVSGLKFAALPARVVAEQGDAGQSAGTADAIRLNDRVEGSIGANDADWYKVTLRTGQDYRVLLDGRGGAGGLEDPFLELRDRFGRVVQDNDDGPSGLNSRMDISVATSGTYYLVARSNVTHWSGDYRLTFATPDTARADIRFDDNDPEGAYSTSITNGSAISSSFINVPIGWDTNPVSLNSYWFQTYLHEIGHALGLGHAGNYNGTAAWGDQIFGADSWQASVMSYFSQTDNTGTGADYAFVATLMPSDILAIQKLYGTDFDTRPGDTVYGAHSNVTGYLGRMFAALFDFENLGDRVDLDYAATFTLFDTGGIDTLDLSTTQYGLRIDLNPFAASDVGSVRGSIVIGPDTVIENAVGGLWADQITGNAAANRLSGNGGNDRLFARLGDDTLSGGAGNDVLNGGAGRDTARYYGGTDIRIDLNRTDAQSTGQGRDRLVAIENLRTAGGADRLFGTDGANRFGSGAGRDSLSGGFGEDRLFGGRGDDRLWGNQGDDTLRGQSGDDTMSGGYGRDTFVFAGGRDLITDFDPARDALALGRVLWGGAHLTAHQIVDDFASLAGDSVLFRFAPGLELRLAGVTAIAGLDALIDVL